jgi:hypothetical protein
MILGLGHQKQVGKNTVARYLMEKHNYKHIKFADPLYELCDIIAMFYENRISSGGMLCLVDSWFKKYDINFLWYREYIHAILKNRATLEIPIFVVSESTGERVKKYRRLLQFTGTDFFRSRFDLIWVNILVKILKKNLLGKYAISDVRFVNEAKTIQQYGGYYIRVRRPGYPIEEDNHVSETDLMQYTPDFILHNDGDKEQLGLKIEAMLGRLDI